MTIGMLLLAALLLMAFGIWLTLEILVSYRCQCGKGDVEFEIAMALKGQRLTRYCGHCGKGCEFKTFMRGLE